MRRQQSIDRRRTVLPIATSFDLDEWLMFDDENVTPISEEDVMKLSGGGDWHTAYLLIYGPRTIEFEEMTSDGASGESNVTPMDTTASANGART